MIARALTDIIRSTAATMPVISITGPRQSGKTTLSQLAFPDYEYVNLENLPTRQFAKDNPIGFLNRTGKGLIIDEAQYAPDLFSYIQVHVDKTRRNGEIILTGSQNFLFMENISQSLAGRVAVFHLLPFSLSELQGTEYQPDSFQECIVNGFFPRVYDQKVPLHIFYPSYTLTYLERDVRQVKNVGDLAVFEQFLKLCAGHIGQVFNQTTIANNAGLSLPTVKSWLSVLQTGFVAFLLPPYFKNYNKRLLKTPKLYFYDTGLACSLLGIHTPADLDNHFAKGALFENFIVVEMMKHFLNRGFQSNLYYWRDNTGNEIDLVVEHGAKIYPFEIKSGQTLQPHFFKNLEFFQKISGTPPEQCFLVYGGSETQDRSKAKVRNWNDLPTFV